MLKKPNVIVLSVLGVVGWWFYEASKQSENITTDDGEGDSLIGAFNPFLNVAYSVGGAVGIGLGMSISINGLNQIKKHEALRLRPYDDGYGYMTIGYGHKILPFESFGEITESEAVQILAKDLAVAENAVNSLVKVPISQNKYDALVSFVFNVGAGAFGRSTMLKLIDQGDLRGAAGQFAKWNRSGGVVSRGLVSRRASEAALFTYA